MRQSLYNVLRKQASTTFKNKPIFFSFFVKKQVTRFFPHPPNNLGHTPSHHGLSIALSPLGEEELSMDNGRGRKGEGGRNEHSENGKGRTRLKIE